MDKIDLIKGGGSAGLTGIVLAALVPPFGKGWQVP